MKTQQEKLTGKSVVAPTFVGQIGFDKLKRAFSCLLDGLEADFV